ncbi:MAG: DinB family protein [Stenomitos frigidus ULC029]
MISTSKAIQSDVLVNADRPLMRSHGSNSLQDCRQQIKQQMEACRLATLALFQTVDYDTFCQQAHPDFSPIGWHLGHIAYTEALWLLEHSAGLPPQYPQYRRLFAADTLPKAERVYLPDLAEVKVYLSAVRDATFAYLETAPLDEQEQLWRWLLQHESQHGETIAIVLELIKRQKAGDSGQRSAVNAKLPSNTALLKTQNSKLKTAPSAPYPVRSPLPTPHSPLPKSASPQAPLSAATKPLKR